MKNPIENHVSFSQIVDCSEDVSCFKCCYITGSFFGVRFRITKMSCGRFLCSLKLDVVHLKNHGHGTFSVNLTMWDCSTGDLEYDKTSKSSELFLMIVKNGNFGRIKQFEIKISN